MNPLVPARAAVGVGDIAVTPHELATQAALEIMAAGGSAVDGAIAANAMLAVVLPSTCGPGGDLFALVHGPGIETPLALNASGRAGAGADADALRAEGHSAMPLYGPHGITTPGCVDGWEALLGRFGTLPLSEVLAPAIRAAGGFPASVELSAALHRVQERIGSQPSAAALYPGNAPPAPGQALSRPDLAATFTELAEGGRDAFYLGAVGAGIVAATEGRVTNEDLARRNVDWVEPLHLDLFGHTAWTMPPNSQGYLVLAAAGIFEQLGPPADPENPAYAHAAIEAYRSVAWERDALLSDPDFAATAPADLVDPARLAARAAEVSMERATRWPRPSATDGGTAYMCTADRSGLGVSLIQSNFHGIGSGLSAGATGVFLQNRGAGFCLEPGHPNELAPGKRPLHTLAPTLWTRSGDLALLLGTRGGHQQPQLLAQIASHLFYAGLSPAAAQAQPRWTMDEFGPGTGSNVIVESRTAPSVVKGLADAGHDVVERAEGWIGGWGPISMISVAEDEVRTGAADPRISTATAAVR